MKTGQLNPGSTVKPPSPVVGELAETLLELRKMTTPHLEQIATLTRAYHQTALDANTARATAQKAIAAADAAQTDLAKRRDEHDAKVRDDGETLKRREDTLARKEGALKQATDVLFTREKALVGREDAVSTRERVIDRMRSQLGEK